MTHHHSSNRFHPSLSRSPLSSVAARLPTNSKELMPHIAGGNFRPPRRQTTISLCYSNVCSRPSAQFRGPHVIAPSSQFLGHSNRGASHPPHCPLPFQKLANKAAPSWQPPIPATDSPSLIMTGISKIMLARSKLNTSRRGYLPTILTSRFLLLSSPSNSRHHQ